MVYDSYELSGLSGIVSCEASNHLVKRPSSARVWFNGRTWASQA